MSISVHGNEFLLILNTVQVLQGLRQIFIKDVARIQRRVVAIESCFHLSYVLKGFKWYFIFLGFQLVILTAKAGLKVYSLSICNLSIYTEKSRGAEAFSSEEEFLVSAETTESYPFPRPFVGELIILQR